jgi:predicted metalloprotease with PDZ domain
MRLSKGKYDIRMLLRDLSGYYGQDSPFKDEELFEKIIEITRFKQLREFFDKYVEGTEFPDYNALVEPFGVKYFKRTTVDDLSPLGGIENGVIKPDTLGRFYISKAQKLDEFGIKHIGLQQDDVIIKWDGRKFGPSTASAVLLSYLNAVKVGDQLEVVVLRADENGELQEVNLTTEVVKIPIEKTHVFKLVENPTDEQLIMRNRWLEHSK